MSEGWQEVSVQEATSKYCKRTQHDVCRTGEHTYGDGGGWFGQLDEAKFILYNDKWERSQHAVSECAREERDNLNCRIKYSTSTGKCRSAKLKFRGLADLVAATDRTLSGRQHGRLGLEPETIGRWLVLRGFCKVQSRMRA